jgi:hypothetical protein
LAITMHGLYDSGPLVSVSLAHSGDASTPVQEVLGLLGPILVTAAGVQLIRRRARAALAADAAEAARLAPAQ